MIHNAQQNSLFSGLISHIIPNRVAILQYPDDTIICLKHDVEGARNIELLLYLYEMMAGLKINFDKSEVVALNDDDNLAQVYAEKSLIVMLEFPYKILWGTSPSRLHLVNWLPLLEKNEKKARCMVG
jgi:hypothetical protein